jgi:uncharacterized protein YbjT (DUF2867 family)
MVLVTGGSGHLGANLVRRLLEEGIPSAPSHDANRTTARWRGCPYASISRSPRPANTQKP